jgi:hypothetical protein
MALPAHPRNSFPPPPLPTTASHVPAQQASRSQTKPTLRRGREFDQRLPMLPTPSLTPTGNRTMASPSPPLPLAAQARQGLIQLPCLGLRRIHPCSMSTPMMKTTSTSLQNHQAASSPPPHLAPHRRLVDHTPLRSRPELTSSSTSPTRRLAHQPSMSLISHHPPKTLHLRPHHSMPTFPPPS